MDILESVRMASATLVANRLRSSLTMLGMIIGNASVIAMIAVGQGAQKYASGQFESLGPNILFIVPGTDKARRQTFEVPKTLVWADAKAIKEAVSSVQSVIPQLQNQLTTVYQGANTTALVMGTTDEYPIVRNHDVAKGRFLSPQDIQRGNLVAVLGTDLAKRLVGSENPIGKRIRIKTLILK